MKNLKSRDFTETVYRTIEDRLSFEEDEFDLSDKELAKKITKQALNDNDFWQAIWSVIDDYTADYCDDHNLRMKYYL